MVKPTTIIEAPRLASRLGVRLVIASETFQQTGSFKFRATHNVATKVPHPRIITASSGNFGQTMAYACQLLGKSCIVVMPDNSVRVKVDAVREYGARVEFVNTREKSRQARVAELAKEYPEAFVARSYDEPLVIEGSGTLGDELAALDREINVIVVPVGGGGLAAGLVLGVRRSGKDIRILGAEPAMANDAARSLKAGRIIRNEHEPQTIADGVRTLSLGEHNWAILKDGLGGVIEVSEDSIGEAMRLLFRLANLKAEPTGALSVAAVMTQPELFRDRTVCCIVTGGNVDPELYCQIIAG
jgi:threonine dehydratase